MARTGPDRTAAPAAAAGASTAASPGPGPPAEHDDEVPTPSAPDERAPTAASPALALSRFAISYINWDAQDVGARLRALAADSVGQARSAMALAASQTGADPELAQAGIANHGTVEAVAPLSGGAHRWVVVTRESTTATDSTAYAGLAPAWHLTLAGVAHRRGGWVVSSWQPES